MVSGSDKDSPYEFYPLTVERWEEFEQLFGSRGACGGCWCMWWRTTAAEFERSKGEPNREAMKRLVESGCEPGILAYLDGRPVGWCSVGPRADFVRFEKSRTLKPVDDKPVWSVVCLFVSKGFRRRGLSVELLKAAVNYAADHGAEIVEGYPTIPSSAKAPAAFIYMGVPPAFERAGFRRVRQASKSRVIMRYYSA